MRAITRPRPFTIHAFAGLLVAQGLWHFSDGMLEILNWASLFETIPAEALSAMGRQFVIDFGHLIISLAPAVAVWQFGNSIARWLVAAVACILFFPLADSVLNFSDLDGVISFIGYNLATVGTCLAICLATFFVFTPSANEWLRRKEQSDATVFD